MGVATSRLLLLLGTALLLPAALHAQLNTCYQATIDKRTITYTGDVWRQILNVAAQRRVSVSRDSMTPLSDNLKPEPKVKKCLGAVNDRLQHAPSLYTADAKYYGTVSSAGAFRKLAELKCGADGPTGATGQAGPVAGAIPDQFFSIGSIVLYRYCGGAEGNGYIFFWGWADKSDSQCIGDSYPAMYKVIVDTRTAKGSKNKMYTLDDLRAAETKGDLGTGLDRGTASMAAEVAALMVAESFRDNNLKYLNLMLLDIAKARKVGIDALLAGYCPPGISPAQCQNPNGRNKGIHPLAFGGAQSIMTLGGAGGAWGMGQGANSDFGKTYEAGLIGEWLIDTQKGKQLAASATCTASLPSDKDPDRVSVVKLFESLLGN